MLIRFINIQLKVKFRAFGFTFGEIKDQFVIEVSDGGLKVTPVDYFDVQRPPVLDMRGVTLKIW